MNKQRILQTFMDLVVIPSPSRHEAATAAYCVAQLERLDFDVAYDSSQQHTASDTPQIIATRPATNPATSTPLALSAHMDVVTPCEGIKPHIDDDGVIRSDGTTILGGDDRAGIASVFEAVESAIEREVPLPKITVLFSVCEEQGVAGAPYYPETLFEEETLCLVLDAEGPAGTITLAAPYHYVCTATFHGRAAHAGVNPEDGISAISMAARAIDTMPQGRHDQSTTSSVGLIEGGDATNIVPRECTVRAECRSLDGAKVQQICQAMDDACHKAADDFGGTVIVEWTLSYPGINISEDDPDVQLLARVARSIGLEPRFVTSGGGSDANILGTKGAKAIPLGTGMTDFHTLNESLRVDDLCNCAHLVEETVVALGNTAQ